MKLTIPATLLTLTALVVGTAIGWFSAVKANEAKALPEKQKRIAEMSQEITQLEACLVRAVVTSDNKPCDTGKFEANITAYYPELTPLTDEYITLHSTAISKALECKKEGRERGLTNSPEGLSAIDTCIKKQISDAKRFEIVGKVRSYFVNAATKLKSEA